MKKILALLLAAGMIFALCACGNKTEEPTTTEIVEQSATETATEAAGTDESTSAAPAESTSAAPGESTTAAPDATTEAASETTTEAAAKKPETKEEIVEYFNKASNNIKTSAKSVTRNYSKISLAGSTQLPGWVNTVARVVGGADSFIDDQLSKNSKGAETFTGAQIKSTYPVENESYASKLTPADVQSATCTENNGKYTITIKTVSDPTSQNAAHGTGHAPKAFNVPLPAVINENVPGFAKNMIGGTAAMEYPSSTFTIVVDAETGHVESATSDLYWTIHFGSDTTLPFLTQDSWTIKY